MQRRIQEFVLGRLAERARGRADADAATSPEHPAKVTGKQGDDRLAVTTRPQRGKGLFVLVWLIPWSLGCLMLTGGLINQPSTELFLFALVFWTSWLAIASFAVLLLCGRQHIVITRDHLELESRAIITLNRRSIPFADIHGIHDHWLNGIEVESHGSTVQFGSRLAPDERAWLVSRLTEMVAAQSNCDRQ